MKLLFLLAMGLAVAAAPPPCLKRAPDPKYLDFWVGDWDAQWTAANGKVEKGRNRITKTLNGKIIHENFEILSGANKGFKGESWSAVDSTVGRWRQTWVDNSGGYIALDAEPEPGDKGFRRVFKSPQGKTIVQRMRFTQVQPNSFVWLWESSNDDEKTWTVSWKIDYNRRKPQASS